MGKALKDDLPLARGHGLDADGISPRPFYLAALAASAIGVAAITLGMVPVFQNLPADARPQDKVTLMIFAGMFIGPGSLYVLLAIWIARRRRWAVMITLVLAMLDVALLGALFFTSIGQKGALLLCSLAAMFVVALAVLGAYLVRCLSAMKRPTFRNAAAENGR